MRDIRRRASRRSDGGHHVIPLVDIMLVLLVIFIVTAPLLTNSVKIDLPKATSAADSSCVDRDQMLVRFREAGGRDNASVLLP